MTNAKPLSFLQSEGTFIPHRIHQHWLHGPPGKTGRDSAKKPREGRRIWNKDSHDRGNQRQHRHPDGDVAQESYVHGRTVALS